MLKNFLLKATVKFFGFFRAKKTNCHADRFLVVSTTGLGDTLWATPALRALRASYPSAYIGVLTSSMGKSVLEGNPSIDEIFSFEEPALPSLFRLYKTIKSRRIQTALIFHVSQRPIIPFCHLIGANEIIGTQGLCKGLDDLLTTQVPLAQEHEILRRVRLVAQVGAKPHGLAMEIFPKAKHYDKVQALLKTHDIADYIPIVCLHPGAKDLFKQWHPEGFIEVGKRLSQEQGCQIIVTGNKAEEELVCKIASQIPRAIPLFGQLDIHELATLQKMAKLLITNDTGPMHLASAVGVPILAIFGPTDPSICGPIYAASYHIVSLKAPCTPCLKKKCREPFCLLEISADHIFEKALSLLRI